MRGKCAGRVKGGLEATRRWLLSLLMVLLNASPGSARSMETPASSRSTPPKITVASYYFGNYHPNDPRNAKIKGPNWSEWELVKNARPRFPDHREPRLPLWGYGDESDPKVMAQNIDAAVDHGIDVFIFDWYHYTDGPFLQGALEDGFLRAPNVGRMKFALMWANHDWADIHPYTRGKPVRILYPGVVTPEAFQKITDYVIHHYFMNPGYWRVEGKPYFSFYDLNNLLKNFGSVRATRAALDGFRNQARAAGLPGIHLNAVIWGNPILPGENRVADLPRLVRDLGFDSVTSYVWIHHANLPRLTTDYDEVRDEYFAFWQKVLRTYSEPYIPNVTVGWDSSPRADQSQEFGNFGYPFMNVIIGNTPERFRAALELTKKRLLAQKNSLGIVNINCWNEWTEGSYLEPDTVYGMQYLDAVRDVFGSGGSSKP